MTSACAEYAMTEENRELIEDEVNRWIEEGWLEQYVKEVHKPNKVRPVLDYRELNKRVVSHPASMLLSAKKS